MSSYSQEAQEYDNRLYSYKIKDIYFYKYDSDFQIKAVKKIEEVKTDFSEQLAQSILSCSSEQWEVFNTLGGKENSNLRNIEYYTKIENMKLNKLEEIATNYSQKYINVDELMHLQSIEKIKNWKS